MAANTESLELGNLFREIRNNVAKDTEERVRMVIYKGSFDYSDWAIHLYRESGDSPPGKTGLGMELVDIIRPMALVDHSIWIEEE